MSLKPGSLDRNANVQERLTGLIQEVRRESEVDGENHAAFDGEALTL